MYSMVRQTYNNRWNTPFCYCYRKISKAGYFAMKISLFSSKFWRLKVQTWASTTGIFWGPYDRWNCFRRTHKGHESDGRMSIYMNSKEMFFLQPLTSRGNKWGLRGPNQSPMRTNCFCTCTTDDFPLNQALKRLTISSLNWNLSFSHVFFREIT